MDNTLNGSIEVGIVIFFIGLLDRYFLLLERNWKTQVFFHPDKILFKNQKDKESEILWVDTVVDLKWKKFYFLNYLYPVTFRSSKDKNISMKILLFLVDSKSVKELNEKYVPKFIVFIWKQKAYFPKTYSDFYFNVNFNAQVFWFGAASKSFIIIS